MEQIKNTILQSLKVKESLLKDEILLTTVEEVISLMIMVFKQKNKVLFCGNGGSAADAQHIAAELSGRFYKNRPPLFAEALHTNSSYVTAVSNDYGYQDVFARAVEAKGRKGDLLIVISTSGNSENIVLAAKKARHLGMQVVAMTGSTGGQLKENCDFLINIPSNDTPRIQEAHILIGHIICEQVEQILFPDA